MMEDVLQQNGRREAVIAKLRAAGCVFAEEEADVLLVSAQSKEELEAMADRRCGGFPLEHVVGWAMFCGLRVEVDPGVFVPRRRSEFIVEHAVALAREGAVVVDLCCGSGALGAVLAARLGHIELHASDIDSGAVLCAARNVQAFGGCVYEGDLYGPLPANLRGRVDLLLVNAPYVPTGAIERLPAEARRYESRTALDGGGDGLDVHRRVAAEAAAWLAPGGCLLIETSEQQAPLAEAIFTSCGLIARTASSEELDATVVIGIRP